MYSSRFLTTFAAFAVMLASVKAETHTVTFNNRCGYGTPTLKANGQTLSTGGPYTKNGPLVAAIAYLQTGGCGDNGENCLIVETTLQNPTTPGSGSSTDLSLIPPHAFQVTSGFGYYNGCDGAGADYYFGLVWIFGLLESSASRFRSGYIPCTMYSSRFLTTLAAFAVMLASVKAETHTVTFNNRCGYGTPTLKANGQTLSTGGAYTINGPLIAAIAYLQTGDCGDNGENCLIVEITLQNPTTPGEGSSTDLSLIPPHTFSVPTGFAYYNGCDGVQEDCTDPVCPTAYHNPEDSSVGVVCQADNGNIVITFCE
ncbi:hypothetical protein OF83DRAFT_1168313 [Amylostereum chailletii]|nr:hypothetical protein OF83DRAFT_1168313 [Amylostereum chailletii]